MGQLEKYGLYVLCLVIFLILGVTIWGGGDLQAASRRTPPPPTSDLKAGVAPIGNAASARDGHAAVVPNLEDLLRPAQRPSDDPKKKEPKPVEAGGAGNPGSDPAVAAGKEGKEKEGKEKGAAMPETRPTYKVQARDTFDNIARAKLGNSSLRTEIARLNPGVDASRLQIGQQLILPTAAEVAAAGGRAPADAGSKKADASAKADASVPAAAKSYTIAKGDTLEGLARRELGSVKRTNEIKELNPGVDPAGLRIGQKILLPRK